MVTAASQSLLLVFALHGCKHKSAPRVANGIGIIPGGAQSPRRRDRNECQTMTEIHPADTSTPRAAPLRVAARDDARHDPLDGRTLYVLGFGIAGGILANAIPLVYFASLYASR